MRTSVYIPLGENIALGFYTAFGIIGIFVLTFNNFFTGIIGLSMILVSVHELGHIWALKIRGYRIEGLVLSIFGPGIQQDRPTALEDSTLVYFSGFVSIILPIYVYIVFPNMLMFGILMFNACFLSLIDVYYWWDMRRERVSGFLQDPV